MFLDKLRDWWRGYSDQDVESVISKMRVDKRPGGVVLITNREMMALSDERTWNWREAK